MPNDHLDTLEHRVARDRAALTHSLDTLANTFAPERMSRTVEGYALEMGQQVWGEARKNPAAFALMGAGLALLFSGTGRQIDAPSPKPAMSPHDAMTGFDARVARADTAMKRQATGERRPGLSSRRLRAAVNSGLERLDPATRAKVLKLRHQAIEAQMRIEARTDRAMTKAGAAYGKQPLAAGAVAFGVGALIATILPNTRREDEMLGAHRDRLMDAASELVRHELETLRPEPTPAQSPAPNGVKDPAKDRYAAQ